MAKGARNLAAAMSAANKDEPAAQSPVAKLKAAPAGKKASSRAGQANISGWFDMPVKYTLEDLRLKRARELGRRVTLQELMGEAFNELFKKHGLPEVAPGAPE